MRRYDDHTYSRRRPQVLLIDLTFGWGYILPFRRATKQAHGHSLTWKASPSTTCMHYREICSRVGTNMCVSGVGIGVASGSETCGWSNCRRILYFAPCCRQDTENLMQVRAGALFRSMEDCMYLFGTGTNWDGRATTTPTQPFYLHRPAPIPCRDKSLSSWVGMVNYLALAGERSRVPQKKKQDWKRNIKTLAMKS